MRMERKNDGRWKGGTGYVGVLLGLPCSSVGKESACNAGDPGSIPGSGRSPGEENVNPLQYPCLENRTDGEAWLATVHGVAKSETQLSDFTSLHTPLQTFLFTTKLFSSFSQ